MPGGVQSQCNTPHTKQHQSINILNRNFITYTPNCSGNTITVAIKGRYHTKGTTCVCVYEHTRRCRHADERADHCRVACSSCRAASYCATTVKLWPNSCGRRKRDMHRHEGTVPSRRSSSERITQHSLATDALPVYKNCVFLVSRKHKAFPRNVIR